MSTEVIPSAIVCEHSLRARLSTCISYLLLPTNALSGFNQYPRAISQFWGMGARVWLTGSVSYKAAIKAPFGAELSPGDHLGKSSFQAHVHGCWQEPIPCGLLDRGPQWCCPQFPAVGTSQRAADSMAADVIKTSKGANRLARWKLQSHVI